MLEQDSLNNVTIEWRKLINHILLDIDRIIRSAIEKILIDFNSSKFINFYIRLTLKTKERRRSFNRANKRRNL